MMVPSADVENERGINHAAKRRRNFRSLDRTTGEDDGN